MPKKTRTPNHHAIRTGQLVKQLSIQHPHMNHKQIFAMASKKAVGSGLHLYPYGKGLHLYPYRPDY